MSELKSKFISQTEIDEKRRKRQEEWEIVRRPEQPLEAPEEEEVDKRSLYERLKEQKDKKDAEYEEQHKLKNQIRGLDSDETDFLEFVSQRQLELEKERLKEEQETLALLREPVTKPVTSKPISADSQSSGDRSSKPLPSLGPKKRTQADILSRIVKRKRNNSGETPDAKKIKEDSADESENSSDSSRAVENDAEVKKVTNSETDVSPLLDITLNKGNLGLEGEAPVATRVVGVLPGIGVYSNSSDTESSSSDSEIDVDVFRHCIAKDVEKMIQAHQH